MKMYLLKVPKYKNATAQEIDAIDNYLRWKRQMANLKEDQKECSFSDWCGNQPKVLPDADVVKHYAFYYRPRYNDGDSEDTHPVCSIFERVGQWKEVDQIHCWFEENVLSGNSNSGYYKVSRNKLENLYDLCKAVVLTPDFAPFLLPLNPSFFKSYNNIYMDEVKETVNIINKILTETDFAEYDIYYSTSR